MARFPDSELPTAWEEDVRANLKKHKSRVSVLREELEKEEMYVEYLDKLLADIERHRKLSAASDSADPAFFDSGDITTEDTTTAVASMNDENKRRTNPDYFETIAAEQLDLKRASLHLDIEAASATTTAAATTASNGHSVQEDSPFVTVISVSSPTSSNGHTEKEDNAKNTFQVGTKI